MSSMEEMAGAKIGTMKFALFWLRAHRGRERWARRRGWRLARYRRPDGRGYRWGIVRFKNNQPARIVVRDAWGNLMS